MFETKIKFTYEPIPEIFKEIAKNVSNHVATIFEVSSNQMATQTAGEAWCRAVQDGSSLSLIHI